MLRRIALVVAMVCASGAATFAEDGLEADAKATPAVVHQVFSGGYWSDGKADGHYRIVVVAGGFEHVSHRLFIQWIAIDHDNQDLKIVRTVSVDEISDLSGPIVDLKPQFRLNTPPRFTVTLQGRDGVKRRRVVTATPDGRYTIK